MRTAVYENFFTKLIATTKCLDINEIEKYISKSTGNDILLVNKQLDKANKLLNERYGRYGVISEQDNVKALQKGYYDLSMIKLSLNDIRRKIDQYNIEESSPLGQQISKDWDNAAYLLQDLLQLENMNLINYLRLLEDRSSELCQNKETEKRKRCSNQKQHNLKQISNNKIATEMPCDIITIEEVCKITRLSKSKIYHMVCNHEIPHYKLNPNKKGRLFFFYSEIEAWLKRNRIGTIEEYLNQFEN
ncbi:helix-turn-helix transcriptional regulator [Parabacteroides provencensis]|uniref:helix-turn-helix transcriptional regulator n=1 Tax=Parabacteroides provencensis TaxID=1944636 RepID=UPI000C15E2E3|nr:helix-turn-helix domain-containing protein [Parabacteroides provencensis]